jgi:hypothetical protein
MTGNPHCCPVCGAVSAVRAVTTYDYSAPAWAERRTCRQIDTYYCDRCSHTWDDQPATARVAASADRLYPTA